MTLPGRSLNLGPDEEPAGRPVAELARTAADLGVLQAMVTTLGRVVDGGLPPGPRPVTVEVGIPGGLVHRIIVADEVRLRAAPAPVVVGFFGRLRPGMDHAPLIDADDLLVADLHRRPGMLAYSSLELDGGQWANLVVMEDRTVREVWRESPDHRRAAEILAPRHYEDVRLHLGELTGGLLARTLSLTVSRYLDYRDPDAWRAERAHPAPAGV